MNKIYNEPANDLPQSAPPAGGLLDVLIVFAKYKRIIVGLPLTAGLVAVAISLALPDIYKASAKLLPPQQAQSGTAALLSQLGGVAGAAAGAAGLKNPSDVYVGMLRSRTIADKLIAKFNLKAVYDTESQEKARLTLTGNTVVSAGKDGLIAIDVMGKSRKEVVNLANGYVEELIQLTNVLAVSQAAQRRLFFERQLEISKNNLADSEAALKKALDTSGVISVDSESRAVVETMGRMRAHISAKEIELGSMKAFVTPDNHEYKRVQNELSSMRAELSRLANGRASSDDKGGQGGSSQVGLHNIKILRDVKYHQMLYELLAKQYEAARLDEAKEGAIIQVLDSAVEPEKKYRPLRAIIVLLTMFVAFLIATVIAFLIDAKEKALRRPEAAAQWQELTAHLRSK